jgi:hypothetical protein
VAVLGGGEGVEVAVIKEKTTARKVTFARDTIN